MNKESGSSLDRDANYLDCFRGSFQSLQANVKLQGVQLTNELRRTCVCVCVCVCVGWGGGVSVITTYVSVLEITSKSHTYFISKELKHRETVF